MLALAAAVLAGLGSTHHMGERSPAAVVAVDARVGDVQGEASLTLAPKVETGDGWLTHATADWWSGPISVGLGYSHRQTSAWSKDVMWVRASTEHGPLRLILEAAPHSRNMETKGEVRLRLRCRRAIVEPRAFMGWHTTAEELGGYAYGVTILVGFGSDTQQGR